LQKYRRFTFDAGNRNASYFWHFQENSLNSYVQNNCIKFMTKVRNENKLLLYIIQCSFQTFLRNMACTQNMRVTHEYCLAWLANPNRTHISTACTVYLYHCKFETLHFRHPVYIGIEISVPPNLILNKDH
jgi:hypothetical protein